MGFTVPRSTAKVSPMEVGASVVATGSAMKVAAAVDTARGLRGHQKYDENKADLS